MSTVLLNKKNIVRGLVIMIRKYRDNTIEHRYTDCKLCQLYLRDMHCGNCLNTILSDESESEFDYPCAYRGSKYPKLDYGKDRIFDGRIPEYNLLNNSNIADFWSEVLEVVKVSKSKDILELSDEFRLKVLAIAEKYKAPPISTHSVTSPQIVINEIPLTWVDKVRKLFRNW